MTLVALTDIRAAASAVGLTPLAAPGLGPYPFMGPESEASGKTMSVQGALCAED